MSDAGASVAVAAAQRRSYWLTFGVLAALTVAEIGVVYIPGIARGLLVLALVLMAVAKAGLVLLVFMHLHGESRGLKWSVLGPFLLPALYAIVLIAEAAWRARA